MYKIQISLRPFKCKDVTVGATVTPKCQMTRPYSNQWILPHHSRDRTKNFPLVTSLQGVAQFPLLQIPFYISAFVQFHVTEFKKSPLCRDPMYIRCDQYGTDCSFYVQLSHSQYPHEFIVIARLNATQFQHVLNAYLEFLV